MTISKAFYQACIPEYKKLTGGEIVECFTEGQCGTFALYLLDTNPNLRPVVVSVGSYEVHVCCIDEEGLFHDILGVRDEKEMLLQTSILVTKFSGETTYRIISKEELIRRMDGELNNLPSMDYYYYGLAKYTIEEKGSLVGLPFSELNMNLLPVNSIS